MINPKEGHCPVCGMKVGAGLFTLEYHKIFFHFCSEQCRETFRAHPGLYNVNQAKERNEIIKRRKLLIAEAPDSETSRAIAEYLQAMMGVKEVRLEGRVLLIHYDLLQQTLAQIVRSLREIDIKLDDGWWQKLRRSLACNTEENELHNLAATPRACCNHLPPRA